MAQIIDLGKIRFQYKGNWSASTEYQFNDVVNYKGSAYCYISTAKTVGTLTSNASFWGLMAKGSNWEGTYNANTTYGLGSIVGYQGNLYQYTATAASTNNLPTDTAYWSLFLAQATSSDKVFYVAPHGTDATGAGFTLSQPFLTLKYACTRVPAGSTIFVKTGTYLEQLPITVPQGVAIIGDNQRTVIIAPKTGNSDDGTTPNSQATMFLLSDGSILNKMTFQGMTGWAAGTPANDITASTVKGVFVRFNAASPVLTKSPYVLECSAIGSGAIGALVDGSVHATGNKSMLFHGYTIITDNGVGYWCKDNGKAEIVSCFTYYAYFGYSCTGGGQIRALNGNNSYGTYGVTSQGFDASETSVGGQIYGSQLNFTTFTGTINVGDTVSNGAGATAVVTNVQTSSQKIYVGPITGTFSTGNTITSTSGGSFTLGSVSGQKGFLLVLSGLTSLPVAGASISITGDTFSYVVQSVSGAWSSTASVISVVLAQEKPSFSTTGTGVSLRYKYSRVRLTGHDFLSIGTGGVSTTNYPNTPVQAADQSKETLETFPGRVFFVNTDQDGNFRVGKYFSVNQATGSATLNANAFNLSGLTSLRLGSIGAQLGAQIDEFSTDTTLAQNSPTKVPTQSAVRGYVDVAFAGANAVFGDNTININTTSTYAGTQYRASLLSGGGTIVWSLSGSVPSGLSISQTGLVTNNATISAGTYAYNVVATSGSTVASRAVTLVSNAGIPILSVTSLPAAVTPSAAFTSTATKTTLPSGTPVHTLVSGSLPSWLTLASDGTLSGTAPATTGATVQTATFTVRATNGAFTLDRSFTWNFYIAIIQGQALFGTNVGTGTFTWLAPNGVSSVSAVAVGAGANGPKSYNSSASGGSGGGLGWKNNITVVPGTSYTVVVGAGGTSHVYGSTGLNGGDSYFISLATVAGYGGKHWSTSASTAPNANAFGGGWTGDGGGAGGNIDTNSRPGGGAGGYAGNGGGPRQSGSGGAGAGGGTYSSTYGYSSGGGVGLLGQGPNGISGLSPWELSGGPYGAGGPGSWNGPNGGQATFSTVSFTSNAAAATNVGRGCRGMYGENPYSGSGEDNNVGLQGGTYGGGGGGQGDGWPSSGGKGGQGGVRIIWGTGRSFPGINTDDVTPGSV